ncbi:seven-hairpin glycosidase [Westerdykella ornata]|uniref:alpha-1,2-Mannosidase n=1 Tax=Westerdykella ornata TaxID=318751 RepID=A0A6A6JGJ3_WESOR|nr:seven-hairpin glycosidase [Westerdykella ornata]KAF2274339.1 seven-hairpin glycosidase [Westerdykella ornata]
MTDDTISALRQETVDIFYHGFDNYMAHAFPEDELQPLTCGPLTRDRANPAHIEVNDVLGNYSLTLIDSLSTLAILASSPPPSKGVRNKPLQDFQDGIKSLVEHYGDGSDGPTAQGKRARGFDLDSKVQVFETVIRGVGGLLSAHQFAVGDLPIRGYAPKVQRKWGREGIFWPNGFIYDGQLLRLATDLAERLMPAFQSPTGLPYPRVNLRFGVPFYANSPYNANATNGSAGTNPEGASPEITETCSAGAGSLVLEFSTLSRLTGDPRYERAAKAAFWAVWEHRSNIGLIGAGIDAESGQWVSPYTGIGAGIDSFFEYSLKTHILLSGLPYDTQHADLDSPDAFLQAWEDAHEAIKRHVYRGAGFQHPHYIQVDLYTGALRAFWIDSLSAYYQGLLTLAGELEEAIETHLLYAALWTRYSAMPERWSTATGNIEHGLRWWGGRPEFIESTWYLYRATQDPWYLHVGEMVLLDIKRRCWTRCGWAGLQDVRTGELSDRMESFFLGETVKYLFLLFDPSHPLNHWDAPFVFTTEGHPLIIPQRLRQSKSGQRQPLSETRPVPGICSVPPAAVPLSGSAVAARKDIFHAASLARLHLMPTAKSAESSFIEKTEGHPSLWGIPSPSNYTYFPWTLPVDLIPSNATSSAMTLRTTFDLSFPNMPETLQTGGFQRVQEGILVNSMSGLRLGMVREPDIFSSNNAVAFDEHFRIYAVSNIPLGRDEKVYMSRSTIDSFNPLDPFFTRIRDAQTVDLVIDAPSPPSAAPSSSSLANVVEDILGDGSNLSRFEAMESYEFEVDPQALATEPSYLSSLLASLQSLISAPAPSSTKPPLSSSSASLASESKRHVVPGTLPTGPGAAPLPDVEDAQLSYSTSDKLSWWSVYVHEGTLCEDRLPPDIPRNHQIVVIPRGGCSFSKKLRNIPPFPPKRTSLQLVVVVSYPEHDHPSFYQSNASNQQHMQDNTYSEQPIQNDVEQLGGEVHVLESDGGTGHNEPDPEAHAPLPRPSGAKVASSKSRHGAGSQQAQPKSDHHQHFGLVQPLLDEIQYTPAGLPRPNPIPLIMVGGGDETIALLRRSQGVGIRRRYFFSSQGVKIGNLIVL